jgi:predicted  nucleic acid-binding Zn-ribbon protein
MPSTAGMGARMERVSFDRLSVKELVDELKQKQERYKQAKANFEFEYAPMVYEEIKEIIQELKGRGVA